jgi:hypothetical protein
VLFEGVTPTHEAAARGMQQPHARPNTQTRGALTLRPRLACAWLQPHDALRP